MEKVQAHVQFKLPTRPSSLEKSTSRSIRSPLRKNRLVSEERSHKAGFSDYIDTSAFIFSEGHAFRWNAELRNVNAQSNLARIDQNTYGIPMATAVQMARKVGQTEAGREQLVTLLTDTLMHFTPAQAEGITTTGISENTGSVNVLSSKALLAYQRALIAATDHPTNENKDLMRETRENAYGHIGTTLLVKATQEQGVDLVSTIIQKMGNTHTLPEERAQLQYLLNTINSFGNHPELLGNTQKALGALDGQAKKTLQQKHVRKSSTPDSAQVTQFKAIKATLTPRHTAALMISNSIRKVWETVKAPLGGSARKQAGEFGSNNMIIQQKRTAA